MAIFCFLALAVILGTVLAVRIIRAGGLQPREQPKTVAPRPLPLRGSIKAMSLRALREAELQEQIAVIEARIVRVSEIIKKTLDTNGPLSPLFSERERLLTVYRKLQKELLALNPRLEFSDTNKYDVRGRFC